MEERVPGVSSRARAALIQLAIEGNSGSGREAAARTGGLVQAARLLQYLEITIDDYEQASESFVKHVRRQMDIAMQREPGPRPLSQDEADAMEDGDALAAVLHLRIETFYAFAKVLLNKLAHAIENYLGRTQPRIEITSHSQLRNRLEEYASVKGLTSPAALLVKAKALSESVVEFREKAVIHGDSPRAMKATPFDAEGRTRISAGRVYPYEHEQSVESGLLHEQMSEIEGYVEEVCSYLRTNAPEVA